MNNIKVFENSQFGNIRSIDIEGEPFFVGKDIADALGYSNNRDALKRHVHDEDKADVVIHDGSQNRSMVAINESGLYSLILSSELPDARKFKRWVTGEVLPAIRKDGGYIVSKEGETEDELLARALVVAQQTLERSKHKVRQLETQTAAQSQIIAELQPKASYYDLILQSKELVPITKIAKDYGMSGTHMNRVLNELRVQYKMGETWLLYHDYQDKGYTSSKTHITDSGRTVMSTYWTQKGRLFIYDLLKSKKGILPMIEREEAS